MKVSFNYWWIRINDYGLGFSTWNSFSVRNGFKGKFAKWTQKYLGFHFNILRP